MLYVKINGVCGRLFKTRVKATEEIMNWLAFFDLRRVHSMLGKVSLMQFEKNWLAEQERRFA